MGRLRNVDYVTYVGTYFSATFFQFFTFIYIIHT